VPYFPDGDEKFSVLFTNARAIKAVVAAIEGTIGPKGLDTPTRSTKSY